MEGQFTTVPWLTASLRRAISDWRIRRAIGTLAGPGTHAERAAAARRDAHRPRSGVSRFIRRLLTEPDISGRPPSVIGIASVMGSESWTATSGVLESWSLMGAATHGRYSGGGPASVQINARQRIIHWLS